MSGAALRALLAAATMVVTLSAADAPVLRSIYSSRDLPLTADPNAPHWKDVTPVVIESDYAGRPIPNHRTEVRSRWTDTHLLLLYVNRYETLYLKSNPSTTTETQQLWDWDVSEAFIGSDFDNIRRYKEFQVSPRSEWVDLDIDRGNKQQAGAAWNSGFTVKARVDEAKKLWYGEMKIPFSAIDSRKPVPQNQLRVGLFRLEGKMPNRTFVSWQATDGRSFHIPEKFGTLLLVK